MERPLRDLGTLQKQYCLLITQYRRFMKRLLHYLTRKKMGSLKQLPILSSIFSQ